MQGSSSQQMEEIDLKIKVGLASLQAIYLERFTSVKRFTFTCNLPSDWRAIYFYFAIYQQFTC